MNSAQRRKIEKILNKNAKELPEHLLRYALPCDGCKRYPIINPEWLGENRYSETRRFKLGCPSGLWGLAEAWETLEKAIENWNWHVEMGDHYCGNE